MILYRLLDCECKHTHADHSDNSAQVCLSTGCPCTGYDAAGHNPELENVLCPQCRLARLEKPFEKTYMCPQCQYVMLETQVLRMVG